MIDNLWTVATSLAAAPFVQLLAAAALTATAAAAWVDRRRPAPGHVHLFTRHPSGVHGCACGETRVIITEHRR